MILIAISSLEGHKSDTRGTCSVTPLEIKKKKKKKHLKTLVGGTRHLRMGDTIFSFFKKKNKHMGVEI